MERMSTDHPWQAHYPVQIPWDSKITPAPLHTILLKTCQQYPNHWAIDFYGKKYRYQELLQLVNCFCKGLQEYGVVKNTKVGLLLPNCPHYIIAYYAILQTGGVVVNFNPLHSFSEIKKQALDAQVDYFITLNFKELFNKVHALQKEKIVKKIIVAHIEKTLPFPKNILFRLVNKKKTVTIIPQKNNVTFESLLENAGDFKKISVNKENNAVLQYTGGTTGHPKGAELTHAALYSNTMQAAMWFTGLKEGKERMLAVLPFFHVFSMTVVMNLSVRTATMMVIHSRFKLITVLRDIARKKITLLPAVPSIFAAINNNKRSVFFDFRTLKLGISGGAPLPVSVKRQFEKLAKCSIVEGYGLTEASPIICANPLFGKHKEGSVGLPLPATDICITRLGSDKALPAYEKGEICVRGPQLMRGYFAREKETATIFQNGYLRTGDLGYMDDEGYLYVVDRIKEMIITNGYNVYPREIEDILYEHPDVVEAAVIGMPDAIKGQKIVAIVVTRKTNILSSETLRSFVKEQLASYKIPKDIIFTKTLPKTLIGKIDKKKLIAQYRDIQ